MNAIVNLSRKVQAAAMTTAELSTQILAKLEFVQLDAKRMSTAIQNEIVGEQITSLKLLADDLETVQILCEELQLRVNFNKPAADLDKLPSSTTSPCEEHEDVGILLPRASSLIDLK